MAFDLDQAIQQWRASLRRYSALEPGAIEELESNLHDRYEASFDVVTARAVAPLERLVAWTVPLLRPGGRLYAVKGERWAEELESARAVVERMGAVVEATPEKAADPAAHTPRVVMIAADGMGTEDA